MSPRAWLIAIPISLLLWAILICIAHASPSCMTEHEARARYPTQWLFWHGAGHCWDATPTHHARHAKKSARALAAPQQAERLPNRETAKAWADTVSIWPDPPAN